MDPLLIVLMWALGGLVLFLATLVTIGYFYDKINPGERLWLDESTKDAWFLGNGWIEDKYGTIFTDLDAYERARDARHPSQTDE